MFKDDLYFKFINNLNFGFDIYSETIYRPVLKTGLDYFHMLKKIDLNTEIIENFVSFYKLSLYNMDISSSITDNFDTLCMLNLNYLKYIENEISFNTYIDILKNRYLIIYRFHFKNLKNKKIVNKFQIVFEFTDFNKNPEILIFPEFNNPITNYESVCDIIFDNLLHIFFLENKIEQKNIDFYIDKNSNKSLFNNIIAINDMVNI